MILTIIVFIGVLAILVLAHEFGHFLVARRNGVKVEEFGFGFPPKIFSKKIGDTIYSINLLPLGGFVKLYGEEGTNEQDPVSFASKSVGVRSKIVVAGVAMNFLLAIVLLTIGFWTGLVPMAELPKGAILKNVVLTVTSVVSGSPAEKSGLVSQDIIIKVDNVIFSNSEEFLSYIKTKAGKEVTLYVKNGKGGERQIQVTPRVSPPKDEGPLGISIETLHFARLPFIKALSYALSGVFNFISAFLSALFSLIKGIFVNGKVTGEVAGPVGIFVMVSQAITLGFGYLLNLIVLLSLTLAVINIFPFPALDGGKFLFLIIEKIRGKKVATTIENVIHTIGFILLMLLILVITYRDIVKIVFGKPII